MKWLPLGSGQSHACTLFVLGWECIGENDIARVLRHPESRKRITVPKDRRIAREIVRSYVHRCGHSRLAYIDAWRRRPRSIDCSGRTRRAE